MRVLFLNPPFHPRFSREQRSPAVTKSGTLYYPKWLATAAGVAIKNGHDVDLVDAPAGGFSVQAVIDRISAKNIEAVVCDTSTPAFSTTSRSLKPWLPRILPCMCSWLDVTCRLCRKKRSPCRPSLQLWLSASMSTPCATWLEAKACGADLATVDGLVWRSATRRNHQQQAARSHQRS